MSNSGVFFEGWVPFVGLVQKEAKRRTDSSLGLLYFETNPVCWNQVAMLEVSNQVLTSAIWVCVKLRGPQPTIEVCLLVSLAIKRTRVTPPQIHVYLFQTAGARAIGEHLQQSLGTSSVEDHQRTVGRGLLCFSLRADGPKLC